MSKNTSGNTPDHNKTQGITPWVNNIALGCCILAFLLTTITPPATGGENSDKKEISVNLFGQTMNKSELDNLLREKRDWWYHDLFFKDMVKPGTQKAESCNQLLQQIKDKKFRNDFYLSSDPYWAIIGKIFHYRNKEDGFYCLFLDLLRSGKKAKESYFIHNAIGQQLYFELNAHGTANEFRAFYPEIGKKYQEFDLTSDRFIDRPMLMTMTDRIFTIEFYYYEDDKTDRNYEKFLLSHFVKIEVLAAADFNDDGIEDIIISELNQYPQGTGFHITYFLIRKLSPKGPLLVTPLPLVKYGPNPLIKP